MTFRIAAAATLLCALGALSPRPALADAGAGPAFLQDARWSLDLKSFYFDRNFDSPTLPHARALTQAAIAKLESGSAGGLRVGLAYYGNALLTRRSEASV